MTYEEFTLEILDKLGVHQVLRGCEYIVCGIEYIQSLNKYVAPESEMIYNYAAEKYVLTPMSIENSMRNVIQSIWTKKENPELMAEIFGDFNLAKKPCNMEFLMLLYYYMQIHMETSDNLEKLYAIWEDKKKEFRESKQTKEE